MQGFEKWSVQTKAKYKSKKTQWNKKNRNIPQGDTGTHYETLDETLEMTPEMTLVGNSGWETQGGITGEHRQNKLTKT